MMSKFIVERGIGKPYLRDRQFRWIHLFEVQFFLKGQKPASIRKAGRQSELGPVMVNSVAVALVILLPWSWDEIRGAKKSSW
jgi:hypothetical protein